MRDRGSRIDRGRVARAVAHASIMGLRVS
jgi:hypothetical protein